MAALALVEDLNVFEHGVGEFDAGGASFGGWEARWDQTRAYGSGLDQLDSGSVIDLVEAEARTRLDAAHDYFVGLRTAMSNRRVYSLYAMCRSTMEACAFATWVFDPAAEPAERLLRGLLLRERSLRMAELTPGVARGSLRRAGCAGLHKIIRRIERVIEGEPGVCLMSPVR